MCINVPNFAAIGRTVADSTLQNGVIGVITKITSASETAALWRYINVYGYDYD